MMLTQNNIPLNRTWKLSKKERQTAHKLLVYQSKIIGIKPMYKMTLYTYFDIIKESILALCEENGDYLDIFDNGKPLFNVYTTDENYILHRVMDGRSLFHSDYGDPYGILNNINHYDSHAFKDWVCNAQWGGHPFETLFGNFIPHCIYSNGYNFEAKESILDVKYSDYWLLFFSTGHRNDEYAMRCFIRLKTLGYPVIWITDNERDRKMLTKRYMVEKEKQPVWWNLTTSDFPLISSVEI